MRSGNRHRSFELGKIIDLLAILEGPDLKEMGISFEGSISVFWEDGKIGEISCKEGEFDNWSYTPSASQEQA
jgi:hypothetical protein